MQFIKSLDPKFQAVIIEGMLAMAQDPGGNRPQELVQL